MLKKIELACLVGVATLGLFSGVANASKESPQCSRETMLKIQDIQQKRDLSNASRDSVQGQYYELQLAKFPYDCVKASEEAQANAIQEGKTNLKNKFNK
ncbi:MAG: hypothetical protein J0H12_06460 [Candidatus Paracaedimonas acanthamoebae]|uniref:Uncharacterized protein n=1 Tax=Candidatus Paracaedimonas acanthamoebae TaxID=244581 RepID=A0A8J7TU42_9PROT|nr:hypothetical protein [Candidatus Paracaedimonas acanthamoebae]